MEALDNLASRAQRLAKGLGLRDGDFKKIEEPEHDLFAVEFGGGIWDIYFG